MSRTYTTQKQIRRAFRENFPELDFRTVPEAGGHGRAYKIDTRCAFVDWIDSLAQDGEISQELAQRVTL